MLAQVVEQAGSQEEVESHPAKVETGSSEVGHQEEGKAFQVPFQAKAEEHHLGKEAYHDQREEEYRLGMEACQAYLEVDPLGREEVHL